MFSQIIATILLIISPTLFGEVGFLSGAINTPQKDFPVSFGPKISAKSALVFDLDQEKVLYQKNPDLVLPIASITKLMSALVFLDNNDLDWDEKIAITASDFKFKEESPYTKIDIPESGLKPKQLNIRPGSKMRVRDVLNAGLIGSLNNLLNTLARITINDNNEEFVDLMNQKAAELGMNNSFFVDPTRLSPKNYSTSRDLIILIKEAMNNSYLKKTLQRTRYDFTVYSQNGANLTFNVKNTDKLLNTFIDFKGGKTGYLDESGYCFVGISRFENRNLAVTVLNSESSKARFQEAKSLIWWSVDQLNLSKK